MAVQPIKLLTLPFLGNPYKKKKGKRDTLPLDSNQTPAMVPSLFFDASKRGSCTEPVQTLFFRLLPTLYLEEDRDLFVKISTNIKDHLENRIQLFATALLMANQTGLVFTYSAQAHAQAGIDKKKKMPLRLAEAHDATLPCLLVTRGAETYVFGEGGTFYNNQNMIMKLPEECNQVDTWIDGNKKEFEGISLRDESIELIQKVSAGGASIKAAFHSFIKALLYRIERFDASAASKKGITARFYCQTAAAYQKQADENLDKLVKRVFFRYRYEGAVDEAFYLSAQQDLHQQFAEDMKLRKRVELLTSMRKLSPTQKKYVTVYHNAPDLIELLVKYFNQTRQKTLLADWSLIAQTKGSETETLSKDLQAIFKEVIVQIKQAYQLEKTPQKIGVIVEQILFASSFRLNPAVNELYADHLPGFSSPRRKEKEESKTP